MSPIVGNNYTEKNILPVLQELLKDESSEVRLNVVSNLVKLAEVAGNSLLSPALLTILHNLTQDSQWRVRSAVFELLGDLSISLGLTTYQKSLESTFMKFLDNSNSSVRSMGVTKMEAMAKSFGSEWVLQILPKIKAKMHEAEVGYSYRMTVLKALAALMPKMTKEQILEHVLPIFKVSMHDQIPNVKFCVCRIIKENIKNFDSEDFDRELLPKLRELTQNADKDVAYYATVAIPN